MKQSEITFKVNLDENNLPINIEWQSPETNQTTKCKRYDGG